jgi:hypothetical protein
MYVSKETLLTFYVLKAGYGTPSGPGGYQGWGAPPGPQGQQMPPPQWGSNYGGPPQQQGYGSYGKTQYSLGYSVPASVRC